MVSNLSIADECAQSSILNLLAGRPAAIVTSQPGTTRDIVEVPLELNGLKVGLVTLHLAGSSWLRTLQMYVFERTMPFLPSIVYCRLSPCHREVQGQSFDGGRRW